MVNRTKIKTRLLRVLISIGLIVPAIFPGSALALTQKDSADANPAIRKGSVGRPPRIRRNAGQLAPFAGILPSGTPFLPSYLVNTTDTSIWNHPSSDPAGIAYWPLTGKLLISDTEIEELSQPHWDGFNVFQSTLTGSLSSNCTTFTSLPTNPTSYNNFSEEPTGVAINPNNNHIFFSDDVVKKIFEVDRGIDNTYCTSDDIITSVSIGAAPFSVNDPEDVAYVSGKLYIAGGIDAEVYEFDLGADGKIGGGDDSSTALTHFDTAGLGFSDLEGIAYNSANGSLFLLSTLAGDTYLGEAAITGDTLLRAYDLSYLGNVRRSGLTVAPASGNPSVNNVYIVSRGLDNNSDPDNFNDGKIWEISLSANPADLIFKDGFESGDFSAWTLATTNSGNLNVNASAALFGSYGMRAQINNTTGMDVMDENPTLEARYRARFYFDPNSIVMLSGDTHNIFQGYSYSPYTDTHPIAFRVDFRYFGGAYQVRGAILNDSAIQTTTNWFTITDNSHFIEVDWAASSASGANNGRLTLWVDGTQQPELTGIDNDTFHIDRIRLGPIAGLDATTSGTYYFDAFESRRQSYIGPFITPPTVISVVRADANPTSAASVNYTVTFSESVTGVDATDFDLTTTGVSNPTVSGVSGSGAVYTVTVNTGTGNGTIQLDVLDDDSIIDIESVPMNGGFTSGEVYTVIKSAEVQVNIAGNNVGNYDIPLQESERHDFPGVDNGPVQIVNANSANILAALRVIWKEPGERTSYSEMMGLPVEQLSSEYWFPWYNNQNTASMDQGFRIANVDVADTTIKVMLGGPAGTQLDSFTLAAGDSVRVGYDVNDGPIQIYSVEGRNILAALRVIWQEPVAGRYSYSEMMGLPVEQLSDEYWFPWYNNLDTASMDQGFRIASVNASGANTVEVRVGGELQESFTLAAGDSVRVGYPVNNGPAQVVCTTCTSNEKIVTSLRVIWKEPGFRSSYSEMMGLPTEQLSTEYWFPWYNNLDTASMDQGFRIANVNATGPNTIQVWVGDTMQDSFSLAVGASVRVGYSVNSGPIRIVCTTCTGSEKILTSLRVIWQEPGYRSSYSEMMGLPTEALSTEYWFPWYNNATSSMDQAFRIAVP
ncbi:MAG: hypothetical protein L0287_06240 [Anaerolineae bacterium]|nr:hypothetical protein [Anaerolineae bacterium]MCI0609499.1 hypothetical protein [Anaerolineae bacterium]